MLITSTWNRADSRLAPSQWEMSLQCNAVSLAWCKLWKKHVIWPIPFCITYTFRSTVQWSHILHTSLVAPASRLSSDKSCTFGWAAIEIRRDVLSSEMWLPHNPERTYHGHHTLLLVLHGKRFNNSAPSPFWKLAYDNIFSFILQINVWKKICLFPKWCQYTKNFNSYIDFPPWQSLGEWKCFLITLHWRHNGHDSVSNHHPHDCLLNRLFRRRSKKISKLRVTGLCAGKSSETDKFPTQMASNAENVSIWRRHHDYSSLETLF